MKLLVTSLNPYYTGKLISSVPVKKGTFRGAYLSLVALDMGVVGVRIHWDPNIVPRGRNWKDKCLYFSEEKLPLIVKTKNSKLHKALLKYGLGIEDVFKFATWRREETYRVLDYTVCVRFPPMKTQHEKIPVDPSNGCTFHASNGKGLIVGKCDIDLANVQFRTGGKFYGPYPNLTVCIVAAKLTC